MSLLLPSRKTHFIDHTQKTFAITLDSVVTIFLGSRLAQTLSEEFQQKREGGSTTRVT